MSRNRPRHADAEIEKAVQYAEQLGWVVMLSKGHAWGRLLCPKSSREGCIVGVYSTPKNAGNHARQIRSAVDKCPHYGEGGERDDG